MLRRHISQHAPSSSSLPPSATTRSVLPGLLSALRPLPKLVAQLRDEANLLSRFTYKNKNQHRGCGWWRGGIVEVDRVLCRVGEELAALVREFGVPDSVAEGSVAHAITLDQVINALLRLPRSLLLLQKALSVMLNASSLLAQLIHSRAFLPFSTVVMALVARLHTLCSILLEETAKLAVVLVGLVLKNGGSHIKRIKTIFDRLPKQLRLDVPCLDARSFILSLPPSVDSAAASDQEEYDAPEMDDVGFVIARPARVGLETGKVIASSSLLDDPVTSRSASLPTVSDSTLEASLSLNEALPSRTTMTSKRRLAMKADDPTEVAAVAGAGMKEDDARRKVKKTKKMIVKRRRTNDDDDRDDGDEIDDIFT